MDTSTNTKRPHNHCADSRVISWRPSLRRRTMSKPLRLSLIATSLLCTTLPALGQQEFPEGKGKELVVTLCNTCHPVAARIGSGYTAKGWDTVMHMMLNQGA